MSATVASRAHVVYRLFNADGELLYVGHTGDVATRLRGHKSDKPWWGEVVEVKTEPVPSKVEAVRMERDAICTEAPRYNVQLVPGLRMVLRSLRVPEKLWTDARSKAKAEDVNISDVVRELLAEWVKK